MRPMRTGQDPAVHFSGEGTVRWFRGGKRGPLDSAVLRGDTRSFAGVQLMVKAVNRKEQVKLPPVVPPIGKA